MFDVPRLCSLPKVEQQKTVDENYFRNSLLQNAHTVQGADFGGFLWTPYGVLGTPPVLLVSIPGKAIIYTVIKHFILNCLCRIQCHIVHVTIRH